MFLVCYNFICEFYTSIVFRSVVTSSGVNCTSCSRSRVDGVVGEWNTVVAF
jgi:hypothetical protein